MYKNAWYKKDLCAAVVPKPMDSKIMPPVLACYGNNPSLADHISMPFFVGVDGWGMESPVWRAA